MKLLIIGATGGTGRCVVANALEQGHEVTVFVRQPDRIADGSDRLRIVRGSLPGDRAALDAAMEGQEAVISTLGTGASLKSGNLMTRSLPVLVAAMEARQVRRLIVMSGYGVGVTFRDMPFLTRVFIRVFLKGIYADKAAGEEAIFRSGLDWTIVYAATLTNGPKTGEYRVGERLSLSGLPKISRADVADFLLRQLADRAYIRKGVLVAP